MRRILLFLLLSLSVMPLQADELDDAVRLLWSGKIDQGMSALRLLAEKGNVKAQLFLGHAYAHENPTVKHVDYSEAIKWFKRASSQGEQGLGVTKFQSKFGSS
jgi:TPR repeat protein